MKKFGYFIDGDLYDYSRGYKYFCSRCHYFYEHEIEIEVFSRAETFHRKVEVRCVNCFKLREFFAGKSEVILHKIMSIIDNDPTTPTLVEYIGRFILL